MITDNPQLNRAIKRYLDFITGVSPSHNYENRFPQPIKNILTHLKHRQIESVISKNHHENTLANLLLILRDEFDSASMIDNLNKFKEKIVLLIDIVNNQKLIYIKSEIEKLLNQNLEKAEYLEKITMINSMFHNLINSGELYD
jgi:hypothetical protein